MGKNKKIAIIGTVGLPANYGGFETLTDHLVTNLSEQLDITVYCSSKSYKKEERKDTFNGARLKYIPLKANGIQSIPYDMISILHALFKSDTLLVLGVGGAILFPLIRLFTNKQIIVSVDGIEWKRDKWNKFAKLYLWIAEWFAVKFAHISIADNESIQDYTAIRYNLLTSIIEYGADHVSKVKITDSDRKKYPFLNKPYAFNVCRIEPENNIHILLNAFLKLPNHNLVIVGNWQHSEYSKKLFEQFSNINNIHLLLPIYEPSTINMLRSNAFVYFHPHSAGGTNPSLVEAMYLELPIITYNVSYNKTTTENKALYFSNEEDIINLVKNTSFTELKKIAAFMKNIADRRYTWQVITKKYFYFIQNAKKVNKNRNLKPQTVNQSNYKYFNDIGANHLLSCDLFYERR